MGSSKDVIADIIDGLTIEERRLAALFCSGIRTTQLNDAQIYATFLTAKDIFGGLFCISRQLRSFFEACRSELLIFLPGLFVDEDGESKTTNKLFPHQKVSLRYMHILENKNKKFGEIRGGVLADAPGLGKTVTMISLCLSTAGQVYMCIHSHNSINHIHVPHVIGS